MVVSEVGMGEIADGQIPQRWDHLLQGMVFVASTTGSIWTKFGLLAPASCRLQQQSRDHSALVNVQQHDFCCCQTGVLQS